MKDYIKFSVQLFGHRSLDVEELKRRLTMFCLQELGFNSNDMNVDLDETAP